MDEESFQAALDEVNVRPCPFEKVILSQRAYCRYSLRHLLADREHAGCEQADAHQACQKLLHWLQRKAQFTLGMSRPSGPLPHNKALRLQLGGLSGLRMVLDPETMDPSSKPIADIYELIQQATKRFETLDDLPYFELLRHITSAQSRPQKKRRK